MRIEHGYEVRGMVEQVTSYDSATGGYSVNDVKFPYDDFGRLDTDKQEQLGEVSASTLQVQYARANGADNHARLNTVTYPNGRVLHHEYSSSGNDSDLGRVSYLSETDANGTHYADYTYLGLGQIVKVDYPQPDLRYNLAHGAGNDPYDGIDRFGRTVDLLWYDYGSSADAVRIKHGYDRAGNRLWRQDVVSAAQATPVYLDELYAYDGMYQLTLLRRGQLNSTEDDLETDSKTFAEQWSFDPLGELHCPGYEAPVAVVLVESPPHGQHGLLQHVLRVVEVVQHRIEVAEEPALTGRDQGQEFIAQGRLVHERTPPTFYCP